LAYGIPKEQDSNLLAISIQTILVAKLIEKAHMKGAICMGDHLFLGHLKRNSVAYPPPWQNT
jgi:hypothetical protein